MKLQRIVKEAEKDNYNITLDIDPFLKLHMQGEQYGKPLARVQVGPDYVDLLATGSLRKASKTELEVKVSQSEDQTIFMLPVVGIPGPVMEIGVDKKLSSEEIQRFLDQAWPQIEEQAAHVKKVIYGQIMQETKKMCEYLSPGLQNSLLEVVKDSALEVTKMIENTRKVWGDFDNIAPLRKDKMVYEKRHPIHNAMVAYSRYSHKKRLDRFLRHYIVWSILANTAEAKSETLEKDAWFLSSKNNPLGEGLKNVSGFYNDLSIVASRSKQRMEDLIEKVRRIGAPIGLSEYGTNVDEVVDKWMDKLTKYTICRSF